MAILSRGIRWTLLSIALLVTIVTAVPFLVPVDQFIPEVTRIASEKLGQPVRISDLRLHLIPTPRIVATDLHVGKRNELTIGKLEIVPELLSFLSGPRTIRLIRAEEVEVREAALAIPGRMPKREAGEPLRVRQILLKQVKLHHSAVKLPEFDLDLELGERFSVELAHIETRDKSLRLTVDPEEGGIAIVLLEAKNWTLPAGAPLTFATLTVQGTLKGEHLDLPKIDGHLYGGTLSGSARADWSKQWQLSGKASVAGLDVVPVQRALGKKPQLSGRLQANATFSARARSPEQLANALSLDGPFEVVGGAYQGHDLSKLGALSVGKLDPGGSTRFDELKGTLQLRGKHVKITDLCARSPLLAAGGNVEVAPDQKLSGKLNVSLAKTRGFVGIPVALGGTASEPSFTPTKGYLIGAAVGTVFLPGIGTSIGSSVGTRIEGQSDCK